MSDTITKWSGAAGSVVTVIGIYGLTKSPQATVACPLSEIPPFLLGVLVARR
jgi:hypothetical protein